MVSEPYLWTGLGALCLGLALGEALLVFRSSGAGRRISARFGRRPRAASPLNASLCFVFLSAAGASAAALLVFCGAGLGGHLSQLLWSLGCLFLGSCLVALPRILGFPLLALTAAAALLLNLGLAGSTALKEPCLAASFLPLRAGSGSMGGEFRTAAALAPLPSGTAAAGPGSSAAGAQRSAVQSLDLRSDRISLVVERIALRGPLRLFGSEHYRIAGFAEPSGGWLVQFRREAGIFDWIAPLGSGSGASVSALGGLIQRRFEKSPSVGPGPLERVDFYFAGPEGEESRPTVESAGTDAVSADSADSAGAVPPEALVLCARLR